MSLRSLAESDLATVLEDAVGGFGWPVTLISPDNQAASVTAHSNDINQLLDAATGVPISGRSASAVFRISSLTSAGFSSLPTGVEDGAAGRPWVVKFDDINGNAFAFKVKNADPDRTLGVISCTLEVYSYVLQSGTYLVSPVTGEYLTDPDGNDNDVLVPPSTP